MIKVSVVIPIYNVEKYLKQCLESIINQTLKEIEIICVNDGSTDGCKEILQEFENKDDRIKVINKKNSGYGQTMNIGIDESIGEYISIVESDDWIRKDMLEVLYNEAISKNLDFIKADYYEFRDNKNGSLSLEYMNICNKDICYYNKIINPSEELETFKFLKYTWSGIYSRKFIEENNIKHNETPGASYQDNGFWFQTFVCAKKVMFINRPFYMYRQDNPNSSIHSKDKAYAVINEFDFIKQFLKSIGETGYKYIGLYTYFRLINSLATINRVDDEYKLELINKLKEDYLIAKNNGELDESLFNEYYIENFRKILGNSDEYYSNIIVKKRNVTNLINPYEKIIIYGAGVHGKFVVKKLKELGFESKIECFAVTEHDKTNDYILGISKKSIKELQKYAKKYLVIISVKKNTQSYKEMLENLYTLGFENILNSEEF